MKIPKRIKEMPWPEPYHAGQQNFKVTVQQPVVDHERWLVVTFMINREKKRKPWERACSQKDFRLVCSKKQNRAAVIVAGERAGRRWSLKTAVVETAETSPRYCYPEISEQDEKTLTRWLRVTLETPNHRMDELSMWTERAIAAELLAERDARGELRNEDYALCPEELPPGMIDYIRDAVLPQDRVLLYKKGNVRGTCFQCRQQVRARPPQRFKQYEVTRCPNCGAVVTAYREGGDSFKADYVEDIVTLQKGTNGKTVFLRQWHLCRDDSAAWENIPAQLDEIARYAVRGNRAAKWQKEAKEGWSMHRTRCELAEWTRVRNVSVVYDGSFYFYLPDYWQEEVEGTSLQYCDLAGYAVHAARNGWDRNTVRFVLDWARYPAIEKLWKAGYVGLVHEKVRGVSKQNQHAVIWSRDSIKGAIRFPARLLKLYTPQEWTMDRMQKTADAWELVKAGTIREAEIGTLVELPTALLNVKNALGHASVYRIDKYLRHQLDREKEEIERAAEEARAKHQAYYRRQVMQAPQTYRDYLRDCVALGLNLDDRAVLFPPDLDAAHARTIAQVKHKANEKSRKAFAKQTEKLARLAWAQNGLLIRPPVDADELTEEGAYLHHCVGGYVESMAKGTTAILLIRDEQHPEKPYYTLELRDRRIIQCRTDHNKSYEMDERVAAFVGDWLSQVVACGGRKEK